MSSTAHSLFDRPVSEQAGWWFVSALVIFALMWFLLLSPKLSEQRELKTSLGLNEDPSRKEPLVREELAGLERAIFEQAQSEADMQNLLVTAADAEVVFGSLSAAALESGVSIRSVERQKEIPRDFFVEVPLRISLEGTYSQLTQFLTRVSSHPKLLVVSRLQIQNQAEEGGGISLSTDCQISAYRPLGESEKPSSRKR